MTGKAKHWSLVNSSGCPTARSGHCATVARDALYVFGGCGHPAAASSAAAASVDAQLPAEALPICLGDLHVYDLARQRWSEGGSAAPSAAPETMSPCRRIGHTMVHDSTRNRLVIFGGSTGHEYFNDTQAFDLATGTWTALATTGERPSPRYKHQAFLDADFMYVVGGGSFEPEGPDLDVYRLPLTAGGGKALLEWERAPVPSTATAAAAAPAAVPVVGEKLSWVSLPSGQGGSAAFAANAEEAGRATPSSPTGRSFHCAFFHGGACYITGGSDGARKFGDMWRFCARETPPPLTTLAARAFVSGATARRNGGGRGRVGGAGGDGKCELGGLPGELREALQRLNMQAEVVL
ncbi:conserved unknown protein [Ectocarpus siliculosus]|uniref:Uncharacterized protein n=1 Tax=Ectocarpus siliculosus TaxID=2880 RepID=D8LLR4_ECTSI|nr:conserved unknown protein [Ectocarpus siliculosus]|eukprot:CBN74695.1 conserved unknown protein [Ectocarpus siliculosus]